MPLDRVDQLPLPNLYWYAGSSGLVLFYAVVYALTTKEGLINTLWSDIWCTAAVLNMACCLFFLLTKSLHSFVFGTLHKIEQQHMRDKFWNFIFYKFIFVFGVMNVQEMQEMLCWFVWFAVLGTLFLTEQLCKDRFQYLSFSPNTPASSHAKVITLLSTVILCCAGLIMVSAIVGWQYGFNHFTFLYSEVFILFAKTLHTIIRYIIHLWYIHHDGTWENQSSYTYYVELVLELVALCVDFVHHVHMLLWANMFLSVASLILLMKLRFLYQEIQRRLKRHRKYITVSQILEKRYPQLLRQDLMMLDETCAICWEKMGSARQLPCGHLFHMGCLTSWLEQDTVCPTCRHSLSEDLRPTDDRGEVEHEGVVRGERRLRRGGRNARRNWLLHFNGASIASWLPTFSLQLHQEDENWISNAEDLHREAEPMFPERPLQAITLDLADAHSISLTVDQPPNNTMYIPGQETGRAEQTPSQATPTTSQISHHDQDTASQQSSRESSPPLTPSQTSPLTSLPSDDTRSQEPLLSSNHQESDSTSSVILTQSSAEETVSQTESSNGSGLRRRKRNSNSETKTPGNKAEEEEDNFEQMLIPLASSIHDREREGVDAHPKPVMVSSDGGHVSFVTLQQRKEQLLVNARRQYLMKEHNSHGE